MKRVAGRRSIGAVRYASRHRRRLHPPSSRRLPPTDRAISPTARSPRAPPRADAPRWRRRTRRAAAASTRGAGEHRVRLAAMVDLVLEQVREQARRRSRARRPRGASPGPASRRRASSSASHSATRRRSTARCAAASARAVGERAPPARRSGRRRDWAARRRSAALERVDVVPVDGEDVVERRLERREEARARRDEVACGRQAHARGEQPVVRPRVVGRPSCRSGGRACGRPPHEAARIARRADVARIASCAATVRGSGRRGGPDSGRGRSVAARGDERARVDVDDDRLRELAAAALQHAHREPPPSCGESARRSGALDGAGALAGTPPQHAPRAAVARGHLQPAQQRARRAWRATRTPRRTRARAAPARRPTARRGRSRSARRRSARGRSPPRRAPARTADAAARSTRCRGAAPAARASAGSVRRISPMPSRSSSISVSAPRRPAAAGQHRRRAPDSPAARSRARARSRRRARSRDARARAARRAAAEVIRLPSASRPSGASISSSDTSSTCVAIDHAWPNGSSSRRCDRRRTGRRPGRSSFAPAAIARANSASTSFDVDHQAHRRAAERARAPCGRPSRRRASRASRRSGSRRGR